MSVANSTPKHTSGTTMITAIRDGPAFQRGQTQEDGQNGKAIQNDRLWRWLFLATGRSIQTRILRVTGWPVVPFLHGLASAVASGFAAPLIRMAG